MFNRFFKINLLCFFLLCQLFLLKAKPVEAQNAQASVASESATYTLMPMFLPQAKAGLLYEDLLNSMIKDQGYEAHCGGAQWVINKTLWGEIDKFFSNDTPPQESFYKGFDPTIFGGTDPYLVDLSKARIPLLRGMEAKTETLKNSSFEGMFGANYQQIGSEYMLNAAGVSQRLLSSYDQCLAKIQNTLSAIKICKEIVGEPCSLNKTYTFQIAVNEQGASRSIMSQQELKADEHIVDVNFDNQILMDWVAQARPNLKNEELYKKVCADLTIDQFSASKQDQEENEAPSISLDQLASLRAAVARLPIDLDSLYRLAFLVLVPQQNKGKSAANDTFYFLQANPQIDEEVHAPIIVAFKIPDFGTNKSLAAGNVDTLELTKMAIQVKAQNTKDYKDQESKRKEIYELAKGAPYLGSPIIKCPDSYPQCQRSDDNALRNVLIDMINGSAPNCTNTTLRIVEETTLAGNLLGTENTTTNSASGSAGIEEIFNQEELNWEKAGDLFTPASKDIKKDQYQSPVNQLIVDKLKSADTNLFQWQLTINSDPPKLEEPMIVNAYLVIPLGETIKDVNKALGIFWNEEIFFDTVRNNVIEDMKNKKGVIPKYYTFKGADIGIKASDSISLADECHDEEIIETDANGVPSTKIVQVCTNYDFGVNLDEGEKEILLPDFGLGFMLRKIQQTLRASFEQTYDYIASCQRVEDMFLGRCSGKPRGKNSASACSGEAFKNIKNMPDVAGIPQFAKDIFTAEIAPRLTPEVIEAYEYAEKMTGIPCEIAAGIHWTEGGSNADQSLFDGGNLHGGSLKEDAKLAMEHLIEKFTNGFDKNNIDYETLVAAIGAYNGLGNQNCAKSTRWLNGGKCPPQFTSEDHPHPLAYIDERHADMDLVFCLDYVEFNCSVSPTASVIAKLRADLDQKQSIWNFSDEKKNWLIENAKKFCYAGSNVCQNFSDGSQYPRYDRPGSITMAILVNAMNSL